jgi:hypothetical protein
MHRSLHSQVVSLFRNPTRVRCGSNGPPQATTLAGGRSEIVGKGTGRHGDSADLF